MINDTGLAVLDGSGKLAYKRPAVPRTYKSYIAPERNPLCGSYCRFPAHAFFTKQNVYCWETDLPNASEFACARGRKTPSSAGVTIEAFWAVLTGSRAFVVHETGGRLKRQQVAPPAMPATWTGIGGIELGQSRAVVEARFGQFVPDAAGTEGCRFTSYGKRIGFGREFLVMYGGTLTRSGNTCRGGSVIRVNANAGRLPDGISVGRRFPTDLRASMYTRYGATGDMEWYARNVGAALIDVAVTTGAVSQISICRAKLFAFGCVPR
jgi:hypothetical protein